MPNSTFLKANFDLFHAKFDLFKAKSAKVDLYLVYDVFCFKDAIFNHLELDLGKIRPKTTTFGHIQWSNFVKFDTGPQIRPRIRNLTSTFLVELRIIFIRFRNSSELAKNVTYWRSMILAPYR